VTQASGWPPLPLHVRSESAGRRIPFASSSAACRATLPMQTPRSALDGRVSRPAERALASEQKCITRSSAAAGPVPTPFRGRAPCSPARLVRRPRPLVHSYGAPPPWAEPCALVIAVKAENTAGGAAKRIRRARTAPCVEHIHPRWQCGSHYASSEQSSPQLPRRVLLYWMSGAFNAFGLLVTHTFTAVRARRQASSIRRHCCHRRGLRRQSPTLRGSAGAPRRRRPAAAAAACLCHLVPRRCHKESSTCAILFHGAATKSLLW
jgi:hypothetical protein